MKKRPTESLQTCTNLSDNRFEVGLYSAPRTRPLRPIAAWCRELSLVEQEDGRFHSDVRHLKFSTVANTRHCYIIRKPCIHTNSLTTTATRCIGMQLQLIYEPSLIFSVLSWSHTKLLLILLQSCWILSIKHFFGQPLKFSKLLWHLRFPDRRAWV